jgi:hypothetical protein
LVRCTHTLLYTKLRLMGTTSHITSLRAALQTVVHVKHALHVMNVMLGVLGISCMRIMYDANALTHVQRQGCIDACMQRHIC